MINLLDCLGIHSWDIEMAQESADDLLELLHLDMDYEDEIVEKCKENFDWDDPTNSIITNMYEVVKSHICDNFPSLSDYVEVYVNGATSSMKLSEYSDMIANLVDSLTRAELNELLKSDELDVLNLAYNDRSEIYVFDSSKELGEEYRDSTVHEEDDSDEDVGEFLLQNYKDNYSGRYSEICFRLSSGRIIKVD